MPIGITVDNVYQTTNSAVDLAKSSMNSLQRGNIRRLFATRAYAVLLGLLVTPSGKLDAEPGSYGVEQRLEVADSNQARAGRLYGTSTYARNDVQRVKIVPWKIDEVTWGYDSKEMARNQGGAQIVNLMQSIKQSALRALIERLESQFLGTITSLADLDNHTGLLFWCRGLATGKISTEGGYNGIYAPFNDGTLSAQLSPGNSSCDASDPTNYRLRGWSASYDGNMSPVLIRQIRQAIDQSNWQDPTFMAGILGMEKRSMSQFRVYWNEPLGHAYADAVNSGPDDRGGNASPFYGELQLGPAATVKTPKLNNIANYPILGVDHSVTKLKVLKGEWLRETEAVADTAQPTVAKQTIYCQSTVDCDDVRRNFCIHTPR